MEKRRQITRRNLAIFTLVVLSSGYVGHWLDGLAGTPAGQPGVGMLVWLLSPPLMVVLLRSLAGDGWADFGLAPHFRGNGSWYAFALLIYPVLTLVTFVIGGAFGMLRFPGLSIETLGIVAQVVLIGFMPQFVKNIFEETAWRGYLTPKFHALGVPDYVGHIFTGLIWGAWHIPYYLYLLDRAAIQAFTALGLGVFVVMVIITLVAWSVVYGEIRLMTGSIWPVVLMHTMQNALVNPLLIDGYVEISPAYEWLVSPISGWIGIVLFVVVGVALNRHRRAQGTARAVGEAV